MTYLALVLKKSIQLAPYRRSAYRNWLFRSHLPCGRGGGQDKRKLIVFLTTLGFLLYSYIPDQLSVEQELNILRKTTPILKIDEYDRTSPDILSQESHLTRDKNLGNESELPDRIARPKYSTETEKFKENQILISNFIRILLHSSLCATMLKSPTSSLAPSAQGEVE